jgi:hypothetical protein
MKCSLTFKGKYRLIIKSSCEEELFDSNIWIPLSKSAEQRRQMFDFSSVAMFSKQTNLIVSSLVWMSDSI